MSFIQNPTVQFVLKIIFFIIFIPFIIIVLFVAVPIIMSIVCAVLLLMYFTGRKLNRNMFFFDLNSIIKNKHSSTKKHKKTDYYDADYTSIDDEEEKKDS